MAESADLEEEVLEFKKRRRSFRNSEYENYNDDEKKFYKTLEVSTRQRIAKLEDSVKDLNRASIPLRFKVLLSSIDVKLKAVAVQKLNYLISLDESHTEYYKIKSWVESICKVPFGIYKSLPVNSKSSRSEVKGFLTQMKKNMDSRVYGHNSAKDNIVRLLAQWVSNPESKGLVLGIQGPMGCGKCFALNTPILMYDGSIKLIQDILVGDYVMGDDCKPRTVLSLGSGVDELYTVHQEYGMQYTVNSDHILCLRPCSVIAVDTETICSMYYIENDIVKYHSFDSLDDMHTFGEQLPSVPKDYILEITVAEYLRIPCAVRTQWLRGYCIQVEYDNKEEIDAELAYGIGKNLILEQVTRVPSSIVYSPLKTRLLAIAGIVDVAGRLFKDSDNVHIPIGSFSIAITVFYMMRSCGVLCNYRKDSSGKYIIIAHKHLLDILPSPKGSFLDQAEKRYRTTIISVSPAGKGDYYGFTIDGNGRFVLGDCTVTHNTTLIKDGICEALGLPFAFIPLGGASDACYLEGHSYTYEGAVWGKIVDVLMKSRCMNPVLFFDELDKVSDTSKGEEIINKLIHMTDSTQNAHYHDKYFTEFEFDLSRCLMIFSYNKEERVNPILKDRMIRIQTNGYSVNDKIEISQKHMIPLLLQEYNLKPGSLVFTSDLIKVIITLVDDEGGVRNLKRGLQDIVSNLNLNRLLKSPAQETVEEEVYTVTDDDARMYVQKNKTDTSDMKLMMYV